MNLVIKGEKSDVLAIIQRLIFKYGKKAKLQDVIKAEYGKDSVILN